MPTADSLLTGERTLPGVAAENYWFRRHEIVYDALATRVRGRQVLDVGCGEGYGPARLAASAATVVGLDYDAAAIGHAAATYGDVARFVRGNLACLPIGDGAVDVVVNLQVIEHVWDHAQFLAECRRVLRPAGELIVSTPNRLTFSPGLDAPRNPFHTVEFTAAELSALLAARGFAVESVLGVQAGPRLRELDRVHGGSFSDAQLAASPENWSARLATDVAGVTVADFVLVDAEADGAHIDEALDLVIVARR